MSNSTVKSWQNSIQGKKGLRLELLEWMDLFKPKYIKRTAVALGMPFFQQVGWIVLPPPLAPFLILRKSPVNNLASSPA
jgi:hypothetical protein